jgi:hypothetical protein
MGDPIKDLQQIIDAHPKSVHQLLISKGINQLPTPALLIKLYKKKGKQFGYDLTAAIQNSNVSNLDINWGQISNTLAAGAGLTSAIGTIASGQNPYAQTYAQTNTGTYPGATGSYVNPNSDKNAKIFMWVGIGVIVLILIVLVILKFRKK